MITSFKTPSDKAEGIAATKRMTPKRMETIVREYFTHAVNTEKIISYKLNDDVNTANKNNSKNKAKNKLPKGNSANAAGKTINNKAGPSAGSNPKAKTTGKIANPANKET